MNMDNSGNITYFLEFYGLPGSGKSTISHIVAKMLRDKGFSVEEPSYDIDHLTPPILRRTIKLLTTILWFIIHPIFFREIYSIVRANNYAGFSAIEQISNIIQKVIIYKRNIPSQIVLWDQGLVQAAISLSINGSIGSSDNLKRLYKLIPLDLHIMYILIDIDKKSASERLTLRKSNDSRVEKLQNKDERERMLQSFIEGISCIERDFGGEKCDGKMNKYSLSTQVIWKITENFCQSQ